MSNTTFTRALSYQSSFMVRKFGMQICRCLEDWRNFGIFVSIGFIAVGCPIPKNIYKELPVAFHIQLSLSCMFVDIISKKYILNHSEYVQIKHPHPPREKMRKKGCNPIKLLQCSTANDSFFSRSAKIYSYPHRHSIIELNDTKFASICKNFLLTKPFVIHNMCTYFICCSCNCKCILTIIGLSFQYCQQTSVSFLYPSRSIS